MVELVQFDECVLDFPVTADMVLTATKGNCRLEFYLGHSGTVAMVHRGQLMQLLQADDFKRTAKVCERVLKLLGAHSRIGGIDLDLLDRCRKLLESWGCADVLIHFDRSAVQH